MDIHSDSTYFFKLFLPMFYSGADLGGGGGGLPSFPQGFEPLPTRRVPPLYYFEISLLSSGVRTPADPKGPPFVLFLAMDPKSFLKASSAPILTNYRVF